MRLRRARANDGPAVCALLLDSRRTAMPWLPEVHTEAETLSWIEARVLPGETWIAEADGQVVGFIALVPPSGDRGGLWWVDQLFVLPAFQGRGVGDGLLERARSLHPEGLRLFTFQRNHRARAFYERRGFVVARLTDGADNEEHEPDVLYEWNPAPEADEEVGGGFRARSGSRRRR